ncbi:MAG: hypothetical protein HFH10_03695 [Dorea sp.]|nr:hypothetical protein [Dorea sp.]
MCKYIDTFGEPQSVYSWKLAATDRVPKEKRDCVSLREKEAEILKASFYTAIEDDCVRKNPFNFALNAVIEDGVKAEMVSLIA